MVTAVEWGLFALLTTLTGLLSAFIVWKAIKPGLERFVADKERTIPAQMKKQLKSFMNEQLEDIDLGGIGAEGGSLGDIGDLLSGDQGGIGQLLKLFASFSGKGSNKGGKMGL